MLPATLQRHPTHARDLRGHAAGRRVSDNRLGRRCLARLMVRVDAPIARSARWPGTSGTTETGSPIGATSRRLRPLEPLQLNLPTAPVTSMHPATRSIHATPRALPTAVSSVPHAHVADLQHLLTTGTGSPTPAPPSYYVNEEVEAPSSIRNA